ncbi:MAG: hypothetical protein JO130_02600 [Solirubrobacterales bacterium]|nr:hypothetical protein [Solirubrobacterales bacterium]
MTRRSQDARALLVGARLAWGALLLAWPDRVLSEGPEPAPGYVRGAVRVLGARHLVEGALLVRRGDRTPPEWSIAIDALHGLSMVALAAFSPALRPDALRSAASAFTLAGLSAYER